jgi:Flp pilus assembly protein TadG
MRRATERARRGGTTVEGAIVLMVFLTLVLGMIDLAMYLLRANIIAEAARQGARQAIVHGSLAPPRLAQWGPATVTATASQGGVPLADAVRPLLVGFDLTKTQVQAEWPDGDSDPNSRVRVTVTTPYRPIMTFIFGGSTYTLRASSTMRIAH